MKLLRYGPPGLERPGLLDGDGTVRDLSGVVHDIGPAELSDPALARLRGIDPARLPSVPGDVRLGPPVAGVPKLVCVGLNYHCHAEETGLGAPAEPVLFMKATSAISGPTDPVVVPRGATKVDWEVELGVVIGATARDVPAGSALEHVAGCLIGHLTVVDPDAGDSHTVTVSDERFEVVEGTLQLKPGQSLDVAIETQVQLDLTAIDAGGLTLDPPKQFVITVLANPFPWHNSAERLDVNADTFVSPIDALRIINELNLRRLTDMWGTLPATRPATVEVYYDVRADGYVSAIDALLIINHLNRQAEGESVQGWEEEQEPRRTATAARRPAGPELVVTGQWLPMCGWQVENGLDEMGEALAGHFIRRRWR